MKTPDEIQAEYDEEIKDAGVDTEEEMRDKKVPCPKSQRELIGEMTNGEAQDFKTANFTLSIYDQNDDLLDTSGISISNISAGQTKSFSAYIDSVPSNCRYKIDYDGGY